MFRMILNSQAGSYGARKRTRTSTPLRELAPEASASANSAIRAQVLDCVAFSLCPSAPGFVNAARNDWISVAFAQEMKNPMGLVTGARRVSFSDNRE
jgi:hypothetical protein